MQTNFQVFASYLETETYLQKNELLKRVKKDEEDKKPSKFNLIQLLNALCFYQMYKDKSGKVFVL
jgi:hypothetical protein